MEPSRDSPLLPLILRHGLLRLHRCSCLSRVVPSKQCREGLRYRFVCGYCLWLRWWWWLREILLEGWRRRWETETKKVKEKNQRIRGWDEREKQTLLFQCIFVHWMYLNQRLWLKYSVILVLAHYWLLYFDQSYLL